jgi:Gas vesicle synthesis protein GvpL/GvpF
MSEARLGCYVYCVIGAEERPRLDGVRGVDPAFGVELVSHGELSAVVSPVSLDEFGSEALKRNLEDMEWLERTARAHQAVLDRALSSATVVPMRLCTIFSDDAHVPEMLEREQEVMLTTLERLRDHSEWSVKVLADPAQAQTAAGARSRAVATAEAGAESAGRAYLARKKAERGLREEAGAMLEGAAAEIHARLSDEAAAATVLAPQNPKLSGRPGEMILNGAYLVHRARVTEFAAAVAQLRERHRDLGLEIELGGPWAPYNFVAEAQPA